MNQFDVTDRTAVYNAIKSALTGLDFKKPHNQALLTIAAQISKDARAINKKLQAAESSINALNLKLNADALPKELKDTLNSLSVTSTDEELRTGARAILVHRIKTDNIKGADLGKFVELLNLGADDDKVSFISVEFADLVGLAHPLPGIPPQKRQELRDLIIEQMRDSDWSEAIESLSGEVSDEKELNEAHSSENQKGQGGQQGVPSETEN